MKFSKALVALTPFFLFDQAAAEEPAEPSSSGAKPKSVVVSSTRSSGGPVHVVIPYHGNEEDNGTDRKKERELETTDHGTDARFLNDVTVNFGPGGSCVICGQKDYQCDNFGNSWNDGERPFNDPLGEPVGEMKVEVRGLSCGVAGPIEISLNGNVLGELASLGNSCPCNTCDTSSSCLPVNSAWYNVNTSNTLKVRKTAGTAPFCVDSVELELLPGTDSFTQSVTLGNTMAFNFAGVPFTSSDVTIDFKYSGDIGGGQSNKFLNIYSRNACSVTSFLGTVGPVSGGSNCRTDTTTLTLDKDTFNDLIGTNGEVEFQMIPSSDVGSFCDENVGTISFTVKPTCQAVEQISCAPSDVPSDQPSSVPSSMPSDVPSDQPSSLPSSMPSDIPSSSPSSSPSTSSLPSSEPSWEDDVQCKKKDPEDDICAELDGRCKVDCEDDENFVCVPGLCSYDRYWDKPTKSPKMRQLKEDEVEVVDFEITAEGGVERKLKATKAPSEKGTKATEAPSEKGTKAPKATKAPKSSCACRVPRARGCKK